MQRLHDQVKWRLWCVSLNLCLKAAAQLLSRAVTVASTLNVALNCAAVRGDAQSGLILQGPDTRGAGRCCLYAPLLEWQK